MHGIAACLCIRSHGANAPCGGRRLGSERRTQTPGAESAGSGVVILEAAVDRGGRVEYVRILRPIPLLDAAAVAAVQQRRYSPLLLNGTPERFCPDGDRELQCESVMSRSTPPSWDVRVTSSAHSVHQP